MTSTVAGSGRFAIGDRVPTGKRWNLNLIITNPSASTRTITADIVQRYCSYSSGQGVAVTGLSASGSCVSVHPTGKFLAFVSTGDSYLRIYRITAPGIIVLAQAVSGGIGNLNACQFSPDGNWIAIGGPSTPYLKVFSFSQVYGAGLAVSNPATLPAGTVQAIAWHPTGSAIIVGLMSSSPYVEGWPWSPGFGTKYTAISPAPAGGVIYPGALDIRPQGDVVAVGYNGSPYISAYAFNPSTGWGSKYTDPSPLASYPAAVRWVPNGSWCFTNVSSGTYGAPWSSGWGASFVYFSSTDASAPTLVCPDDYVLIAAGSANITGCEWNPLGIAGRTFSSSIGTGATGKGEMIPGSGGGILAYPGATTINMKTIIDTAALSGGIGSILAGTTIAANSVLKVSGHVMNEGERLVVSASGQLEIAASAVEVTL